MELGGRFPLRGRPRTADRLAFSTRRLRRGFSTRSLGRAEPLLPGRRLRTAGRDGRGSSAPARTDVWLARLERPVDGEIARDARLGHPPDQVDERRREQRGMALIGECELDPADQEGQRERFVRMSTSCPRARKPCANPGAAISAGCPRRSPPRDCISSTAAGSPSAIRSGQPWTEYLLPSCFQARPAPCARPGSGSRRKPRRSAARATRSRRFVIRGLRAR